VAEANAEKPNPISNDSAKVVIESGFQTESPLPKKIAING
jgi:hypothetical protein